MKNKIISIIIAIFMMSSLSCIFSGCSGRLETGSRDITTRLSREYGYIDASHEIVVDKETGVMYLCIYRGGICVMVDENGKPMLYNRD